MDFFNDIFHYLTLLAFYFLNIIYILLYIDFILSIFFQHSNILTRASHHWCVASNIVLVLFWIDELIHLYSIYLSSMNIEFHLCYENYRRLRTRESPRGYVRSLWRFLTHCGRDKMAASFQSTFSNEFSWMKVYEFRLTFHWSLFLRVQLTIFQHWFR